jgi:hypothetical protein
MDRGAAAVTVISTPLEMALRYGRAGKSIFPCVWDGDRRKRPLVKDWDEVATFDAAQIADWWRSWPRALIGLPTGEINGAVVLDIDVKAGVDGRATLAGLGFARLPWTPTVHTASGGLHLYFALPDDREIRNTGGGRGRGIGAGLDWRGEGGYVIAPSPGSGYSWALKAQLARVPAALMPKEIEPAAAPAAPIRPATGLTPYAEGALNDACKKIIAAPRGQQNETINAEVYSIGTLAGAGAIPADFARRALGFAVHRLVGADPKSRWHGRPAALDRDIDRIFADGMRHPRGGAAPAERFAGV